MISGNMQPAQALPTKAYYDQLQIRQLMQASSPGTHTTQQLAINQHNKNCQTFLIYMTCKETYLNGSQPLVFHQKHMKPKEVATT